MPKATDITGTFRVPEEAWGKFWNTMLTIPGGEVTPNVRAQGPAKKPRSNGTTAGGSTTNCIVLRTLASTKYKGEALRAELEAEAVTAGKSGASVASSLQDLKTKKLVKRTEKGWAITAAGRTWLKANCKEQ